MRQLFSLLITFTLLSCNKEKASVMSLKAHPTAAVTNQTVTLGASSSTGEITQYGWQVDITSPTTGSIIYSPNSSHKGGDFISIKATVVNTGTYVFGLTVYDKDNNQDYATVSVVIK